MIQVTIASINNSGLSIWNLKKAKLYIDRAVINTVTNIWHAKIVYTLWMNKVRAAP